MNYYIKISNDLTIELSGELNTQERIKLCEEIIEKHPQYFKQCESSLPFIIGDGGNRISRRLEIMADYILASTKNDSEYTLLTEYKDKRNKNTEIVFSDLERKFGKNHEI